MPSSGHECFRSGECAEHTRHRQRRISRQSLGRRLRRPEVLQAGLAHLGAGAVFAPEALLVASGSDLRKGTDGAGDVTVGKADAVVRDGFNTIPGGFAGITPLSCVSCRHPSCSSVWCRHRASRDQRSRTASRLLGRRGSRARRAQGLQCVSSRPAFRCAWL